MPDVEQHSDPFEEQLSADLRRAGAGFDADRAALVAAGAVRGRRRLLRRRAAVVGGAASLALVGLGGALVLPGGNGSAPRDEASVGTSGHSTTATPTPAPAPVSGDALIRALEKLLPEGTFSKAEARGTDEEPGPYVSAVYDDGKGAAAIGVSLGRVRPGSDEARQRTECPGKVFMHYDACGTTRLPDGSVVMVMQGYEYPDRRVDTKLWSAELVTPEGQQVGISEWNAAAEKDAPITRPEPPLSASELRRLAAARVWRDAVDAMPEDPGRPAGDPTPSATRRAVAVAPTLRGLLPKGRFTMSEDSGDDTGFGYLVVDDGKGRFLVQVNVQDDMSDVADDLFGSGSEKLPDGTRVAVHQGPSEKGGAGAVMWTVDTLRSDGRRVVISELNSGAPHDAATRTTPALTVRQLRTIALSAKWWR
ncbi:hypothetical protein [Streptomyces sp. SLBN-31]|uniref:hypothetical protein n=1 Tax=Streptomyces sp. SLBN-31 TaxID=2768444 RepID=UPI0011536E56|nr:hypothetical protein [Streptomyces sp. SLBN-31]TQJ89659.1 hypothetical protein FBY22_0422 [Streptomyces sp. SLBN-31]